MKSFVRNHVCARKDYQGCPMNPLYMGIWETNIRCREASGALRGGGLASGESMGSTWF
jgi:hypothetical protein